MTELKHFTLMRYKITDGFSYIVYSRFNVIKNILVWQQ